jgi:hypothetical protein
MFNAWTVFGLVPVSKLSLAESANFSNIFEYICGVLESS